MQVLCLCRLSRSETRDFHYSGIIWELSHAREISDQSVPCAVACDVSVWYYLRAAIAAYKSHVLGSILAFLAS